MTGTFLKEETLQILAINSGTSSGVRKHRFVTNGKCISYARFKKGTVRLCRRSCIDRFPHFGGDNPRKCPRCAPSAESIK